jgi:integrase
VLTLKLENIDLATGKMTVWPPKTERIPGKEFRVMPIFTALRPFIEAAVREATPGQIYLIGGEQGDAYRETSNGPNGWVNTNLRTPFGKIIKRAGLTPWPRLFHTLRASCETDLLERFPISAVTEWLGHSASVALKHYTRVPEHVFERVARGGAESAAPSLQNAMQSGAVTSRRKHW